jgi:hypothetical protein
MTNRNPAAATESIRTMLTFKTATDAPANVTQAANIARALKFRIGRGIGAGKYDCEVSQAQLEEINAETVLRCAHGTISF